MKRRQRFRSCGLRRFQTFRCRAPWRAKASFFLRSVMEMLMGPSALSCYSVTERNKTESSQVRRGLRELDWDVVGGVERPREPRGKTDDEPKVSV